MSKAKPAKTEAKPANETQAADVAQALKWLDEYCRARQICEYAKK